MPRMCNDDQAELGGCGLEEYLALRRTAGRPVRHFQLQRAAAAKRGIGWELTLWEWWTIWNDSGKFAKRGQGQGYVMCRKGDLGPYAVGNVFIATAIENSSITRQKKTTLPIGVTPSGSKFRAKRIWNGKVRCLGSFATPELAHAAYLSLGPIGAA